MDDESEIDRRTAVFLRAASKLPSSSNVHLAADLAVTGKHFNPIQRLQKKNPTCTKCCLTLEVSLRIKKRKRMRVLTLNCSYCGKRMVGGSLNRKKK